MTTRVSIDGVICKPEDAKISVFDRGFLYGDSVFETVRTYGGKPYALESHLQRLERSAELVFIQPAVPRAVLTAEVLALLQAAGNEESYVRIMLTRGQGGESGLQPVAGGGSRRVLIVRELQAPSAASYASGIAVVSFRSERPNDLAGAAGAKVGNYLVAVLAMREAAAAGAQEALIVSREGTVLEGATSNVFWVEGGTLLTPPVSAGILPGITREGVLAAAERLGVPCRFACPTIAQLQAADEVFISSSIREVLPVVKVDGVAVGSGAVGEFARRLHTAFRQAATGTLPVA